MKRGVPPGRDDEDALMTKIDIRAAEERDLGAVRDIYAHAVETGLASFELVAPDLREMTRRYRRLIDGGFPYLVAESGGLVVGYAYAGPYRDRPAYRFTVEDSIYVAPGAQGRGIGRVLLGRLVAMCEARGFRQMVAVIGDSGNLGSIRLHAALGFAHAGVLAAVGWKHGRWVDSVLMQRPLGTGDGAPPEE